ncbi:MAG: hypothetical protein IJF66_02510 [Clostridia bacterium]|nr:hypothetical protein [Clostridia bacterium]
MFTHSLTKKVHYSVREKINYYNKVVAGKISVPAKVKRKAKLRLKTLNQLNNQSYLEPTLIITDDKHFGNSISKPRLCVAYGIDDKNRIRVFPIQKRTSKAVILDNNVERQVSSSYRLLDKSDVYETKYIQNVKPLSKASKKIIKSIHK